MIKAIITYIQPGGGSLSFTVAFIDTTEDATLSSPSINIPISDLSEFTLDEIKTKLEEAVLAYATANEYSMTETDIIWSGYNLLAPEVFAALKAQSIDFRKEGIVKENVGIFLGKANTSDGQAVIYLTTNGAIDGSAVFSEVFLDYIIIAIKNKSVVLPAEVASLSPDKKTLTLDVNRLIINIGILSVTTAADEQVVPVVVFGVKA